MITLLAGPPFNKPLEEIGWFTRRQIQTLFLRHRNAEGLLDLDAVMAERRALKQPIVTDSRAEWRKLRRLQARPDYLIDAELREMDSDG